MIRSASLAATGSLLVVLASTPAWAQPASDTTPAAPAVEPAIAPSQIHLDSDVNAPPATTLPEAPPEAPPPPPHKKGIVLEGSLGALGFLGQFRHLAPPGVYTHLQLGYEPTDWLMLFGEGELAFTDTSEEQSESAAETLPLWGFGGGARFTAHVTPRVGLFAQGSIGAMTADVPKNSLVILGYPHAESLGIAFAGRVGVEWYQIDRHMALGVAIGVRDATGFASTVGSDIGLMADATGTIRYTF